ncbi:MAG: hypothetical protein P1P86_04915 [Bacteroidales bacterium]|nr:hypothetical protein [Bacteroidales bacterium]
MKAAVAGGLWASFEIIVGSLLHNLHLPFSGTILATFSVIWMISFLQIWNETGLIWRAGLICGLMKSLSPSAVILGPMTGIMMEALVMELLIYLLGRNMFAYIMAGIAALLSTIMHKLASLFILYGNDLVNIYVNLFRFIQKQLGLENAESRDLITGIIVLYILLGAAAALAGSLLGKRALQKQNAPGSVPKASDPFVSAGQEADPNQAFRIVLLFMPVLMIPGLLLLINRFGLQLQALVPSGLYLLFLLLYYKRIIHRLKKPFFWSQLVLMTLLAGLFCHPQDGSNFMIQNGFLVGLEMSLRAVLIVSAFSGLSVEIRNPMVTGYLLGLGFGKAYAALSLAFNSLPAMLDRSARLSNFLRKHFQAFSDMLVEAEMWMNYYQKEFQD